MEKPSKEMKPQHKWLDHYSTRFGFLGFYNV
jgi:hypothetical protein